MWGVSTTCVAGLARAAPAPLAVVLRDATVGHAREHPGTYAAAQRAPDPADDAALAAARAAVDIFLALLSGYGLLGSDAIHATRSVRAALHGFVSLEAAGGFGLSGDVEESFASLVDLLDRGLGGLTSARSPSGRQPSAAQGAPAGRASAGPCADRDRPALGTAAVLGAGRSAAVSRAVRA